jgi:hypothetical protein
MQLFRHIKLATLIAAASLMVSFSVQAQDSENASIVKTDGAASQATAKPRGPEPKGIVPRYGIVWEGKLTRSGKPKREEGWKWLREQGTNTIVNFRANNDVDYQSFGFSNVLWIPMDNGRLPTSLEAETYLAWIQEPKNQPVNIQCAEGKDRTGMMAALARYAIDGWSMDDAIQEAALYRKGEHLASERIEWLRAWAKAHPPGSHKKAEFSANK